MKENEMIRKVEDKEKEKEEKGNDIILFFKYFMMLMSFGLVCSLAGSIISMILLFQYQPGHPLTQLIRSVGHKHLGLFDAPIEEGVSPTYHYYVPFPNST